MIFEYQNYRNYLEDYYQAKKAEPRGYSFKDFSKAAGIQSPNYLKLIIDRSRDLTVDNIFAFAQALELGEEETHYFELLVHYDQCQTLRAKSFYLSQIQSISNTKPRHGVLLKNINVLNDWYAVAIIITANNRNVKSMNEWARFLGISVRDLQNAVDELIAKKIIQIRNEQFSVDEDFFIFRDKKSLSEHQKKYLYSQLKLSMEKFDEYQKGAKFISHTLLMNDKQFDTTVGKIFDFLQSMTVDLEKNKPLNQIAQLNLQFFKIGNQEDLD